MSNPSRSVSNGNKLFGISPTSRASSPCFLHHMERKRPSRYSSTLYSIFLTVCSYFQLAQRLVENCLDLFIQHKIYDNCSQYAVEKYMSELDDEAMNNRRLAKYVLSHASIMIDPTRYSEELPVINNMITSLGK